MTEVKWPRYWYNYPIILCAIGVQYVWAFSLMLDASVVNTTVTAALLPYLHLHNGPFNAHDLDFNYIRWALIFILLATATLSFIAFQFTKKIYTVLALVPQQFIMVLSSGGVVHSIYTGTFADGTARSSAFLLADQSPVLLLTIFHTWALILILLHGTDTH